MTCLSDARWAAPGCCAWPVEGGLWEPHYCGFAVGPAVSDVELALAIAEAAMDEAREAQENDE